LSLGSGRAFTSESSTISDESLEELLLDGKNEERTAQIKVSGIVRSTEEPNSAGWGTSQNSSDDVSNKAIDNRFGTAVNATALPNATERRLITDIEERSCTKAYEIKVLPNGKQVGSATECYLAASVHGKCRSSIPKYERRACAKVYVKMEGLAIGVCTCAE